MDNTWEDRLKDAIKAAEAAEEAKKAKEETKEPACDVCCPTFCACCKTENCQDRLAPHIENWRTAHGPENEEPHTAGDC